MTTIYSRRPSNMSYHNYTSSVHRSGNSNKPSVYSNYGSSTYKTSYTDTTHRNHLSSLPPSGATRPLPRGPGPLDSHDNKFDYTGYKPRINTQSTKQRTPLKGDHDISVRTTRGVRSPIPGVRLPGSGIRSPSMNSLNSRTSRKSVGDKFGSTESLNHAFENKLDLNTGKNVDRYSQEDREDLPKLSNGRQSRRESYDRPSSSRTQSLSRDANIERLLKTEIPANHLDNVNNNNRGLLGLRNLGNTCYMNCMLQGLVNTRPLLELLLNENWDKHINRTSRMKGSLIDAFAQLVKQMWREGGGASTSNRRTSYGSGSYNSTLYGSQSSSYVSPSEFRAELTRYARRFSGYQQQDAQEFLIYLIEGLHEDINRVQTKVPKEMLSDKYDSEPAEIKADESWKWYKRYDDSLMVDLFVGQLKSSLVCQECKHVSNTFDNFWEFPLPLKKISYGRSMDLADCFEEFTREEVLDGDERPTCEKCKKRQRCKKKFTIWRLPPVLILHLKRFDPMSSYPTKLTTKVNFPVNGLDLSPYVANNSSDCIYDLYSVSNHSGTARGGHYTAYTKHPYSGRWHHFNDQHCTSISESHIVSSEAYVLFYEKRASSQVYPSSKRQSNL